MTLEIVKYGHPILRRKGAVIEEVTPEILRLIDDLLETMYEVSGIGLAAQQVGHALQLTVIDVREVRERPSYMWVEGTKVDPADYMPMVLINPELTPEGEREIGPEGCLSFPELYAEIERPEMVDVQAINEKGEKIRFRCGGLLSRAIQHETDHLHGILFIDRMSREIKESMRKELEELQAETKADLKAGKS